MTADQLRKSILQQAIQGKLVPQDPNDEPASVLLERIREEKARLVEEKKIKKEKNPSVIFRGEDNSYYEKFTLSGEVKCIDEEIPFEIPNGWEWCRIFNIFQINPKNICNDELEVAFIPMEKLSAGYGSNYSYEKIKWGRIKKGFTHFANGDIAFAKITPCFQNRKSAVFEKLPNGIGAGTTELKILRTFAETINRYYLLYFLKSPYFVEEAIFKGTANQQRIISGYLEDKLFPLPPLTEQQRIVAKIEELIPYIEHYGKAQTELDMINKNIKEQLKKSILQYAIEGKLVPQDKTEGMAEELLLQIQAEKQKLYEENKLKKKDLEHSTIFKGEDNKYYEKIGKNVTEITDDMLLDLPVGWKWCRLKDIVFIFTGATFKKEEVSVENIDIRILRGGNIQPFRLTNRVDDIFLPKDKVKENILLKKNDIVTPAVTSLENIGKMARVEFDLESTTVGGFVFILRQFYCNDIVSKYLLALLSSPIFIDYIKSITNKSGQAFYNISKNRLEMTLLPLPPLAEQQRIVESIEAIFRCIEN
ncbi:restriction endonuclease subunit S [Capnocytophaga sp. CM59]|uniref:restriction endonuclease subunit S n=1 Tax=Capnocytophaga sp. CM59 TaxID=936370 RepID=UPI00027C696C|nr:restriction endonuclease subunit S [Capnocytophaga sp. CM59]EJU34725.1 type I restriction modification DNA specificity domain protein [Capnocytophaga sp. CM59]